MAASQNTEALPAYSRHQRIAHCDCPCHCICSDPDCRCFNLCICECHTLPNYVSTLALQRSQDTAEDVISTCGNCNSKLPDPCARFCPVCGFNSHYKASSWAKVVDKVSGGLKTVFAPSGVRGVVKEYKRKRVEEKMKAQGYIWIVRH